MLLKYREICLKPLVRSSFTWRNNVFMIAYWNCSVWSKLNKRSKVSSNLPSSFLTRIKTISVQLWNRFISCLDHQMSFCCGQKTSHQGQSNSSFSFMKIPAICKNLSRFPSMDYKPLKPFFWILTSMKETSKFWKKGKLLWLGQLDHLWAIWPIQLELPLQNTLILVQLNNRLKITLLKKRWTTSRKMIKKKW